MKIKALLFVLFVMAGLVGFVVPQATAAETVVTPDLVQRIKDNCTQNLATLNRLHKHDVSQRTIKGELYNTISSKLMVPLNERLATNQLDGSELIALTADFNKEYNKFYSAYITYDNALSRVLNINCQKEPVSFYDALVEAREKRVVVDESNERLVELILLYEDQFETFRKNFGEESA